MQEKQHVIIITGANGGIGQALCDLFSKHHYYVVATDVSEKNCQCDYFIQYNLEDLVDDTQSKEFKKIILSQIKSRLILGLINNAAVQILSNLDELAIQDFKKTLTINLTVPLILSQLFSQELEKANGHVVNIGSIHSKLTKPNFISYATSKAALLGLTKALAIDIGHRFRVNIIQPAATETEMLLAGFDGHEDSYSQLKHFHPVQRIAQPDEIAQAALFLVSNKCNFMSGSSIDIDGGIGSRLFDPE